jgi:UDP-N-acetylmuramoylalanine--D-glutamate ligase
VGRRNQWGQLFRRFEGDQCRRNAGGSSRPGRRLAIILGGDGKGQDFSPLRSAIEQHARAVALIAAVLEGCCVPTRLCVDMAEAVRWCAAQAQTGEAVLLSPACASMDMYRDYAHRAEAFVAAVRSIEREAA